MRDAPVLMKVVNPSSQDRTPRHAIVLAPSPAAPNYRASGLVQWHKTDVPAQSTLPRDERTELIAQTGCNKMICEEDADVEGTTVTPIARRHGRKNENVTPRYGDRQAKPPDLRCPRTPLRSSR